MVSFDTNILIYATLSVPLAKTHRARDLLVRGMRMGSSILLLQTLAEFSSVAIRKAGIGVDEVRTTIDAWRAVLRVQGTEDDDLSAALDAVKNHQLAFSDAYLWAAAQRSGVRHLSFFAQVNWLCVNNRSSGTFTTSCADPPHYRPWPPV